MKKVIMETAIVACIALCATVWPPRNPAEEIPAPIPTPAVCATESAVAELKPEAKTTPPAEKEKEIASQAEATKEIPTEPKPNSIEVPAAPEAQPTPELEATLEAAPEPSPAPTPKQPAVQTTVEPQSGDMVYVPGFGWIESQGPNRVEYAADMYENGNKIGIMG